MVCFSLVLYIGESMPSYKNTGLMIMVKSYGL